MVEINVLQKLFVDSFNHLLEIDKEQLYNNVAERNLCSRLGIHMQKLYDEIFNEKIKIEHGGTYYADTEYNRNLGGKIKRCKIVRENREEIIDITCDLILHSRGKFSYPNDNLIAIEMKKSNASQEDKEADKRRLEALTLSPKYEELFSQEGLYSADGRTHPENVCGYSLGYYIEFIKDKKNNRLKAYFIEEYINGKYVSKTSEKPIDHRLDVENFGS